MDFGEEASEREKGENYIVFWTMILPLILIAPGHCSSRCGIFSNFVRLPDIRMGDGNRVVSKRRVALHMLRNSLGTMPGAGERHSTRDKDHEEGGSAYTKAGSSLGSAPGYSRASTPKKPESAYFIALCSHL